jgi:sugar lactone lactonase YvrE
MLLMGLAFVVNSQAQEGVFQQHHKREMNQFFTRKIDPNAKWYNTTKTLNLDYQPGRLIMLHLWQPESIEARKTMHMANMLREQHSFMNVVTLVWSTDSVWHDERIVNSVVDEYRLNHPFVVADDFLGLQIDQHEPQCMFIGYTTDGKNFGTYTEKELDRLLEFTGYIKTYALDSLKLKTNALFPKMTPGEIEQPLHYPVDMVCANTNSYCFVVEPENHRVLVIDDSGSLVEIIGTGVQGNRDGRFGSCRLNAPTGLAYDERNGVLYISDTGNNQVKRANLATRDVVTVLGNGETRSKRVKWVDSTAVAINRPTGLHFDQNLLFIAMTDDHQIWQYDPASKRAKPVLGDGSPGRVDGARGTCSLDTPVAITGYRDGLVVYEQAGSAIRMVNAMFEVSTLALPAVDGIVPGSIGGMASKDKTLFLSDTKNNRILSYNGEAFERLAGSGRIGSENHKKKAVDFFWPGALSVLGNQLFVSDRNKHMLRKVNTKKGSAKSVYISDLDQMYQPVHAFARGYQKAIEDVFIAPGLNTIYVELALPPHLEWYMEGRNEVEIEPSRFNRLVTARPRNGFVELEVKGDEVNQNVNLQLYMTVRDKRDKSIHFRTALLLLLFVIDDDEAKVHDLKWEAFPELSQ